MLGVLDTSVVISGLRSDETPDRRPDGFAISAATLAELHYGMLTAADPDERFRRIQRLTAVQRSLTVLPMDADVAASYGLLAAATQAAGRQARRQVMGLIIAATAHAFGAAVLTRNPDDFRAVEKLVEIVGLGVT